MFSKIYNIFHGALVDILLILVLVGTGTIFYKSYKGITALTEQGGKTLDALKGTAISFQETAKEANNSLEKLGKAADVIVTLGGNPEQLKALNENLYKTVVNLGDVSKNAQVISDIFRGYIAQGYSFSSAFCGGANEKQLNDALVLGRKLREEESKQKQEHLRVLKEQGQNSNAAKK